MRAIPHYNNDHPELDCDKRYVSALIILNAHATEYYNMLMQTGVIWTSKVRTAATDGIYFYINQNFLFEVCTNDSQRAFVLAHEAAHKALQHMPRMQLFRKRGYVSMLGTEQITYSHSVMNCAMDYVINADLVAHGLECPPMMLLSDRFSRDDLASTVYIDLYRDAKAEQAAKAEQDEDEHTPDESESNGDSGDAGDESGESIASDGDDPFADSNAGDDQQGDDHLEPKYDGTAEEIEEAIKEDAEEIAKQVDQALDSLDETQRDGQKQAGSSASFQLGGLRHLGGSTYDVNWQQELAELLYAKGTDGEQCWSKINRRKFLLYGVVAPTRRGSLNRLAVIIDISSSVSRTALQQYLIELAALIDALTPESGVLVLFTNTSVVGVVEVFNGQELLEMEIPEGGGTQMSAGTQWMTENGLDADITMVFTDGELYPRDMKHIAEAGAIMVLDRKPDTYRQRQINQTGIRTIVACA